MRELQNTIERAVILTESGRPVTAAALGLPGDYQLEETSPRSSPSKTRPLTRLLQRSDTLATRRAVRSPTAAGGVQSIADLEKQAIKAALQQTEGNRTQAAAVLGISIRTLRNKLQEYREAGDPIDAGVESADA